MNNRSKILDLVLSNKPGPSCVVEPVTQPLSVIDPLHPPIHLEITTIGCTYLKARTDNSFPNFQRANYDSINTYLKEQNWIELFTNCDNVNKMLGIFYNILENAIDKFVPSHKPPSHKYPIWFSKDLIKTLKRKETCRQRYRIYNNPLDKLRLDTLNKMSDRLLTDCYRLYISSVEDMMGTNIKSFWSFIKSKRRGTSTYPDTISHESIKSSNGTEICNIYANFFSSVYSKVTDNKNANYPLNYDSADGGEILTAVSLEQNTIIAKMKCMDPNKGAGPDGIPVVFITKCISNLVTPLELIFKKSLDTGTFPAAWKEAKVVPVYKDGDSSMASNYRPISILSAFAKLFESLLCPIIQSHIKQSITHHQHGFVPNRSTCTNLVSFTEVIVETLDTQGQVDVIYTDFSKAFDRVSHDILVSKLAGFGFAGPFLSWLGSYLRERSFYVVMGGYKSTMHRILSGVPQGSHLGPTLFNIFVNDIVNCFSNSTPFLYADDLKFCRSIKTPTESVLLQEDINRLVACCDNNGMSLNIKKCFHIKFTRKLYTIQSTYKVLNEHIQEVNVVKDLGVLFDKKLTFVPHIDHIIKKASKMLGFIIRNGKVFRKSQTKKLLYNTLVRSVLEYCSVVWQPHYATHNLRIERIQKRFMWSLVRSSKLAKRSISYKERLDHFGISSLQTRRDMMDLQFVFNF